MSPLYCTVRLSVPGGSVTRYRDAVAEAGVPAVVDAADPLTEYAVPTAVPLLSSCTVPVGAAPLLTVVTVAVAVKAVPEIETLLRVMLVGAFVMVTGNVDEVLAV